MATLYKMTLYKNTGFGRGNIPDNPGVLAGAEHFDVDPVWLRQNEWVSTIQIRAKWEEVQWVDYCTVGSACYIVESPRQLNDSCCELTLITDPVNTLGGVENLKIIGGWTKRAHVAQDELFGNILPEPWVPSQRLRVHGKKLIHDVDTANPYKVAVATCNLAQAQDFGAKVASVSEGALSGEVCFPVLPTMDVEGSEYVYPSTPGTHDAGSVVTPSMYAWDLSDPGVREGITAVRSLGIDSAIVSSYAIPRADVSVVMSQVPDKHGYIERLSGVCHLYKSGLPYVYDKTVKNKKAIALYNSYTIVSIGSGSEATWSAEELYSTISGDLSTAPDFFVKTDPSSTGAPVAMPTYLRGEKCRMNENGVMGATWYSSGLAFGWGASGSAIMGLNANRNTIQTQMQQDIADAGFSIDYNRQTVANTSRGITGTLATLGHVVTGQWGAAAQTAGDTISGGMQAALTWDQTRLNQRAGRDIRKAELGDRLFSANVQANLVPPEIKFPISPSAAVYFGNSFLLYQTVLEPNDLARFDRFLTAYGYAQDKPADISDLTNRQKFNYILIQDAQIKSATASQTMCNMVADAFSNGIRIWHELPNAEAYNDNPPKGGTK